MSFLDKMKSGAMAAGDASKRAAQRAKITADITMLEGKVTTAKKEFGLHVFDAMVQANKGEVERLFTETRAKVEALESDLAAKKEKRNALKESSTPRSSSFVEAAPPGSGPPPSAPPPGGPPPGGPPPGWRVTQTADGKDYYYNESTGETSWTMPPAPVS